MNKIHNGVILSKFVELGENIYIGPNCTIGLPGYQHSGKKLYNLSKRTYIEDNTVILGNSVICRGTKIGKNCRLDYHSFVGERTIIGNYCVIELGGRIYDEVQIANFSTISGLICNTCVIGKNSIVQGDLIHRFNNLGINEKEKSPKIGNNCFIGRKSLIIGPIIVANGSYIAAGTIVTKDTISNRLYMGTPARDVGIAPKAYKSNNSEFNQLKSMMVHEDIFSDPSA